jgi:hypothetical protein
MSKSPPIVKREIINNRDKIQRKKWDKEVNFNPQEVE